MGDISQLHWVKKNKHLIKQPVLEIGSKFYDKLTSIDYRALCNEVANSYTGVDIEEGENVDIIVDFTQDISIIERKLENKKYRTVICNSVLEHIPDVFKAAKNISSIIDTGGVLFVSVPFAWEFHGYPHDYWRFTPKAIEFLFPDFEFEEKYRTVSGQKEGEILPLGDNPNYFLSASHRLEKKYNLAIAKSGKIQTVLNILFNEKYRREWISSKSLKGEWKMLFTSINMIGIKK